MESKRLCLWARVHLNDDAYVITCRVFGFKIANTEAPTSSGGVLGEYVFDPPASLDRLPESIANPLRIMLMRGKSLEDVGDWLNRNHMWLTVPDVGIDEFLDITRRSSWKNAAALTEKTYRAIIQYLSPEKTTKDSGWRMLSLD